MTGTSLEPRCEEPAFGQRHWNAEVGAKNSEPSSESQNPLSYLPLVRSIAAQMLQTIPKHVEIDDLVQAGVLGLLDAIQKYDRQKGVKFSSYAHFRIRGAMLDSLRSDDWCPREMRRTARRFRHNEHALTAELGRTPEVEEIAAGMSMEIADYNALRFQMHGATMSSLEEFLEGDDESSPRMIADLQQASAPDELIRRQRTERMADCIEALPEREQMVLTLYYFEELTMKEIAAALGVVESRVSQIHSAALGKLRQAMAGH